MLFGFLVLSALALDLGLLRRSRGEEGELTLRSAALRSAAWAALSLLFALVVLAVYGQHAALTYVTAYLLEETLSIDNVFVFVLIFSELGIPPARQPAVTRDPFLVYTSNVFAMLGLRSLYFVLAGIVERFRFIRVGLAAILIFFGGRLLLGDIIDIPTVVSLGVIAVALTLSVVASIKWPAAGETVSPRG